jgi:hypothetical protein
VSELVVVLEKNGDLTALYLARLYVEEVVTSERLNYLHWTAMFREMEEERMEWTDSSRPDWV